MGGSSNKAKPTAQEIEQLDIHTEQWDRYKETGIPMDNEWIRRTTGLRYNEESGGYDVDPNSKVLTADGMTRFDTTAAVTANTQAAGGAVNAVNPNRLETAAEISREGAVNEGASAAGITLQQDSNAKRGVVNAVLRGKGLETESLQRQSEITRRAQNDAIQSVDRANQRAANTNELVGQLGGLAAVGIANNNGALDSLSSEHQVTRRTPGDHHPS